MRRFLIDASCIKGDEITISDESEIRHMRSAVRLRPGAEVLLSDGSGTEYYSKLIDYYHENDSIIARFTLLYTRVTDAEPQTRITLFQCLPKRGKLEYIIQKSVELGVHGIVPVFSERSVPSPQDMSSRITRWNRIAEEASKQSGRGRVPQVAEGISVAEIPAALPSGAVMLLPYEQERSVSIKHALRALEDGGEERDIALIIGPEGGFAEREVRLLEDAGARVCTLGRTILRTETAGPASIAMILYELEMSE